MGCLQKERLDQESGGTLYVRQGDVRWYAVRTAGGRPVVCCTYGRGARCRQRRRELVLKEEARGSEGRCRVGKGVEGPLCPFDAGPYTFCCLWATFLFVLCKEKPTLLHSSCVSPLCSHPCHTHNVSATRCVGFLPHRAILCNTSSMP